MSTAVSMTAAVAHLLEMPAKIYERDLYVRLHRTLYWNFGRFAGVAGILSVLLTSGMAVSARRPSTTIAAGCLAASHAIFWALVSPANRAMLSWPITAIPSDWRRWRNQWECSHAVRAGLATGGNGRPDQRFLTTLSRASLPGP